MTQFILSLITKINRYGCYVFQMNKGLVNSWPAVSDQHNKWITGKRFEEVDKECFVPVEVGELKDHNK